MVSHPDYSSERTVARRAPSVASSTISSSTVRRHHHHHRSRSHAGGSHSYNPTNEFPCFTHTGDVEIIVTSAPNGAQPPKQQRYLLHRLILAQCSGFFEAGTSEQWSRSGPNGQQEADMQVARVPPAGGDPNQYRRRWRYELDWGSNGPDSRGETPMLVQRDPSSQSLFGGGPSSSAMMSTPPRPPPARNKPTAPTSGFFRTMANFSSLAISQHHNQQPEPEFEPIDDLLRDYDNLFRIFYNYPPNLDPINIANAYVECKSLLQLADMYDALEVVGPRIDHHLLRFGSRLWKQIAKYPPSYLKLGYLARSRAIFSEALTHVVGQWPLADKQLRGHVPQAVIDLIEDKVDELEELRTKTELKLYRLTLTTSRGERVTPQNAMLEWLAVSVFRAWVAENMTPAPAPILKPSGGGSNGRYTGTSQGSYSRTGSSHTAIPPPPLSHAQHPRPGSAGHQQQHNTARIFRTLGAPPPSHHARSTSSNNNNTAGTQTSATASDYLTHDDLKRFLKLHPEHYTRENLRRFEKRVEEMKNRAREVVRPLTRNHLEFEGGMTLGYFTCARVEGGEWFWEE